jgi:hypothetical protein
VLTPEDCRKRAELSLREAEAVHDACARAALCRLAERWTTLASEIEQAESTSTHLRRPMDLVRRTATRTDSVRLADMLRARLGLISLRHNAPNQGLSER